MGLLLMQWLPEWNIQPGLYAMCAAAAMLGGVFRSSISLVVIVVEGTQARLLSHQMLNGILASTSLFEKSDGHYGQQPWNMECQHLPDIWKHARWPSDMGPALSHDLSKCAAEHQIYAGDHHSSHLQQLGRGGHQQRWHL